MNDPKFQQHGGDHVAEAPPHRPHWKRIHHSPFFWVAAGSILLAMVIYIMTDNLSLRLGQSAQRPVPVVVP